VFRCTIDGEDLGIDLAGPHDPERLARLFRDALAATLRRHARTAAMVERADPTSKELRLWSVRWPDLWRLLGQSHNVTMPAQQYSDFREALRCMGRGGDLVPVPDGHGLIRYVPTGTLIEVE